MIHTCHPYDRGVDCDACKAEARFEEAMFSRRESSPAPVVTITTPGGPRWPEGSEL